jgi:4-amino-4-deoxy-L-arabinose transferase-like glycosyltransferase
MSAEATPPPAPSPVPRPPSDAKILVIAFAVGVFICFVSAIANAFFLATSDPVARIVQKGNAVGGVVAILLVWRLLRWSRERNQLVRERAAVVAGLNHEVRNAIHTISLSNYPERGERANAIQESVARIEQALDEYVPSDQILHKQHGVRLANRRRGKRQYPGASM